MKKKKSVNRFDSLVEKLIGEFTKIPNFDLTQKDEVANIVFNIVTYRMAEISSYKELVCSHFIPATNKAIFESKQDFKNSKYKALVNINDLDFQETLYDTVRLAYVGLFHKLENYISDVVKVSDMIFGNLYETEIPIERLAKEKFQFNIRDWQQFYITHKINWICNCVKHKDAYPVKEPKPACFRDSDETQRIKISSEEFKTDCESLIKFYPIYLQIMFLFAQYKYFSEQSIDKNESPELYNKLNELEMCIRGFIEILRN